MAFSRKSYTICISGSPNGEIDIKTLEELLKQSLIEEEDLSALQQVADTFNLRITSTMRNLISEEKNDPIRKQFIPSIEELNQTAAELEDPIGDTHYEAVKGVVHRYPDRCLLKIVSVCAVYCRFCFRKEMIGPRKSTLTPEEIQAALEYIHHQPDIWEVILTGGDPLILKPSQIKSLITSISQIPHVEVIRIHTRIPVVDPHRISDALIAAINTTKAVYVVLHANHPKELTAEAIKACARLVDAGIPLLSQSVLLKGVNDDPHVLAELMRAFVKNRIKPYYLHHPDLAKGTRHFRLPIEEGQRLVKALQGHLSGLCQPTYMLEIPGGAGKMPISPCYLNRKDHEWEIEDYQGQVHAYCDS